MLRNWMENDRIVATTRLVAHISNTPDRILVSDEKAAVARHGEPGRCAKYERLWCGIVGCATDRRKTGGEILIASGRFCIHEVNTDNLVAVWFAVRTGRVKCDERVAFILRRKLRAIVEHKTKRRRMRFEQDIWHDGLGNKIGTLAAEHWIAIGSHIGIRPAEEIATMDMSKVVRRQPASQQVALIDGSPKLVRARIKGEPDNISQSAGIGGHGAGRVD